MGISCGASLIKYVLFLFNFIWLVLGGVVIYFGVTISTWSGSVQEALDMNLRAGSLTILVTGVVIFLLAFLGCCGACKENSCMLSTYGGMILLLVIIQCVGVFFAFKYRSQINDGINDQIDKQVQLFKHNGNDKTNLVIQEIQKTFECCGVRGYEDYNLLLIPVSCCGKSDFGDKNAKTCTAPEVEYKTGCAVKVKDTLVYYLGGLGGVAIGLILIQLLIMLMACCLSREAKN